VRDFGYSTYDVKWVDSIMFGIVGSVLVIAQMAIMSAGLPIHLAMLCGLGAAVCWIVHALERQDKALLFVNVAVGGFAFVGLMP